MLPDELKSTIQTHYSQLLKNRGLKPRHGQKVMIAEIARGLMAVESDAEGLRLAPQAGVTVVEAGTGTGKTLAYMLAALPVAKARGKKLVVATATVALQEQVMHKDLPDLLRHSELRFSHALAKGRGRYLCLAKLDGLLHSDSSRDAMLDLFGVVLDESSAAPDRALYQNMLERLADGQWQGDRDDWTQVLDDAVWRNVAVEHGQCAGSRCSFFSNCAFFRAREQLQNADCIVANHDLVLADLSLGGGVILPAPEDSIYIFDEAHHLPLKGISHFSQQLRLRASLRWLEQLPTAFTRLRGEAGGPHELADALDKAEAAAQDARAALAETLPVFGPFEERTEPGNGRDLRVFTFEGGRIEPELRELCRHQALHFDALREALEKILERLKKCMESEGGELERERAEAWFPLLGGMNTRAAAGAALWQDFGREEREGQAPRARWLSFLDGPGEADLLLSCSPVLAAAALESTLWSKAFAVLLTSATLSALGSFDFLQRRAGLPADTRYQRIASPFDYSQAVLLRLPRRGFDPGNALAHTQAIAALLPRILDRKAGSLVLFSSRRQMQDVLALLDAELLALVSNQDDYSKQHLLARHRERIDAGEGSVLFGLAGLAEGIDLPGAYCTHVVIAKIPFAVPNDPVEATLAWWVEAQGRNPFMEISVPEAATRLVQACGRLVRSEEDHGTITLLDERLLTKRYGQSILDGLPPYRREIFTP